MPNAAHSCPYAFLTPLARHGRGGTVQRIQDIVRDAIIRLEFAPGDFIDKAALCERLGVSRFPVSEALGRLADEGFVEVLPQRGTRVTRINIADVRQAMFIRRALECEAVRVIAPRVNDNLLALLDRNLQAQRLALDQFDGVLFYKHDLAFHEILLAELGYDRVKAVVEAARGSLDRMRLFLLRNPRRQSQTYIEHLAIVEALNSHDANAAAHAMEVHLDNLTSETEMRAAKNPEVFAAAMKDDAADRAS